MKRRGARLNQGSCYVRILRALQAGDIIYLPWRHARMPELLRIAAAKQNGKCKTELFLATARTPQSATYVVRVTMLCAMVRRKESL